MCKRSYRVIRLKSVQLSGGQQYVAIDSARQSSCISSGCPFMPSLRLFSVNCPPPVRRLLTAAATTGNYAARGHAARLVRAWALFSRRDTDGTLNWFERLTAGTRTRKGLLVLSVFGAFKVLSVLA